MQHSQQYWHPQRHRSSPAYHRVSPHGTWARSDSNCSVILRPPTPQAHAPSRQRRAWPARATAAHLRQRGAATPHRHATSRHRPTRMLISAHPPQTQRLPVHSHHRPVGSSSKAAANSQQSVRARTHPWQRAAAAAAAHAAAAATKVHRRPRSEHTPPSNQLRQFQRTQRCRPKSKTAGMTRPPGQPRRPKTRLSTRTRDTLRCSSHPHPRQRGERGRTLTNRPEHTSRSGTQ